MKTLKTKLIESFQPVALLLAFGAFCVGLFYESVCIAVGMLLCAVLLFQGCKNKKLYLSFDFGLIAVGAVCFGFLATALWGVDKYYSLLGFFKFFPLLLFYILLAQSDAKKKEDALRVLPLSGAVMTVLSGILTLTVKNKDLFSFKGRLSGFFQYPSAFALFLIIGLLVLSNEKLNVKNGILGAILIAGVFLSGSRTSFAVLAVAVVGILFTAENKNFKRFALITFALIIVCAAIYSAVDSDAVITRFLKISLSSVTLKGRMLYFKDVLKEIPKHPFGLGYMGYYFAQGSFQNGVYSNSFIHNDALQLLLDLGWIPAILCAVWVGKALLSKEKPKYQKLIIIAVLLHCMMDFDLQYLVTDLILLACLCSDKNKKEVSLPKGAVLSLTAVSLAGAAVAGCLGLSSLMYLTNNDSAAVRLCKYNTSAQINVLANTEDFDEKNEVADIILKNNQYVSNAYSAKAQYYYASGDIENTIDNKCSALEHNRYSHEEYVDFCEMFLTIIPQYIEMEDYDSAQYCINELAALQAFEAALEESTDPLAYDLPEKPDFSLDEDYREAIDYYLTFSE